MKTLLLIFRYDWYSLSRSPLFVLSSLLVLLLNAAAIYTGRHYSTQQKQTILQLQAYEQAHYQRLAQQFDSIHAAGIRGSVHTNPAQPTKMALSSGFRIAWRQPSPLQLFNFGQSDLHPYYYKVTAHKQQTFYHQAEIRSGLLSFAGHFDLSFVLIYLLPLVVIALGFDILPRERREGTLFLLASTPVSLRQVIFGRLLFRFLLLTTLVLLSAAVGLAWTHGISALFSAPFAWWILLASAYLGFWFSICFLVNALGQKAATHAGLLVSLWLLMVLFGPALLQYFSQRLHPVPARSNLVNLSREAGKEIEKRSAQLLEDYIQDHPELVAQKEGLNMQDFGTRYFVQLQEIEETIAPVKASFDARQQAHEHFVRQSALLLPPILMQEAMNEVSATSNFHFNRFADEVVWLQKQLRELFIPRIFLGKLFTSNELALIPTYQPQQGSYYVRYAWLQTALVCLVAWNLLILLVGNWILQRRAALKQLIVS